MKRQELKTVVPKFKIGDICRCLSGVAYRRTEQFKIISIGIYSPSNRPARYVYIIQFLSDFEIDCIPIISQSEYKMEIVKYTKQG